MKIRTLLATLFIALLGLATPKLHAVIYDSSIPVPDADILLNFDNSGLDWVYAGPLAPNAWGVGAIYTPDYRADEGWRYATVEEWANRPTWQDFAVDPLNIPAANSGFSNHSAYRFASEYWSDFSWVDLNDSAAGLITGGPGLGSSNTYSETFYVRATRSERAPDATTTLGLLFGALAALVCFRRR